MLLDFKASVEYYNMHITGILHVGAHLAEEAPLYEELGVKDVIWVEANIDDVRIIDPIVTPLGHRLFHALITDKVDEKRVFHITNNQSMSSSIFEFGTHAQSYPDTVFQEHRMMETGTIDLLLQVATPLFKNVNTLVMDIQGAELLALKGAVDFLSQVDYIYTEVNSGEVYKGCAKVEELDAFLSDFERVQTGWVEGHGWGDAIYLRRTGV